MLFLSSGKLVYSTLPIIRLVVEIDPDISKYYRSLIPKSISFSVPMHPAHISVVRKEIPPNLHLWNKHQNEQIEFEYDSDVCIGKLYCWLKVHSQVLETIREELGLPRHRENITLPPDKTRCFHVTIANFKHQNKN